MNYTNPKLGALDSFLHAYGDEMTDKEMLALMRLRAAVLEAGLQPQRVAPRTLEDFEREVRQHFEVEGPKPMSEMLADASSWLPEVDDLPEILPPAGYKYKSKDMDCPACKAKAGDGCFEMTNRGPSAKPTKKRKKSGYHNSRVEAAKERNR